MMDTGTRWLRSLCVAVFLAGALAVPKEAVAEKVVIYRCTDASGAVTLQNDKPCPRGSRQEKRTVESADSVARPASRATPTESEGERTAADPAREQRPAAPATAAPSSAAMPTAAQMPAGATPVSSTAATPAMTEPATTAPTGFATTTAEGERLPPPVLYECRTYDDDTYLSENGTPQQRCVVLTTTGLGGLPASGAGTACEMKTDTCQRVPDGALCDRWRQRLREAEAAERFGKPEDLAFVRAEVERIGRIVRESVCGE